MGDERRVEVCGSEISRGNRLVSVEECLDCDMEGSRGKRSISVTLSDPVVFDCSICIEHLCIPVFQCENGHIACASCCIKVANKCPSCCFPIGYNRCRAMEKVLESAKVSCVNKRYGCKEILSCSKKTDHENACMYVPCSCPFHGCDFVGTSTKLYAHFSDKHASSAEHIFFDAVHPIYIEKHQSYAEEKVLIRARSNRWGELLQARIHCREHPKLWYPKVVADVDVPYFHDVSATLKCLVKGSMQRERGRIKVFANLKGVEKRRKCK